MTQSVCVCGGVYVCTCVCVCVYMCVCVFFPLLETAGLLTDDRFGVDVWCASNIILWLYIIFDALCIYIIVCWRLYILLCVGYDLVHHSMTPHAGEMTQTAIFIIKLTKNQRASFHAIEKK